MWEKYNRAAGKREKRVMNNTAMRNMNAALLVSKWDRRIRDNKRRRNAEIRRRIFLLVFAAGVLCMIIFGFSSTISEAGDAKEEELTFKYYRNICVEQGETLTSIAKTYADKDHYETLDHYIQEVVYINHLQDADSICAGYYLIVPYYSNELLQ